MHTLAAKYRHKILGVDKNFATSTLVIFETAQAINNLYPEGFLIQNVAMINHPTIFFVCNALQYTTRSPNSLLLIANFSI